MGGGSPPLPTFGQMTLARVKVGQNLEMSWSKKYTYSGKKIYWLGKKLPSCCAIWSNCCWSKLSTFFGQTGQFLVGQMVQFDDQTDQLFS